MDGLGLWMRDQDEIGYCRLTRQFPLGPNTPFMLFHDSFDSDEMQR